MYHRPSTGRTWAVPEFSHQKPVLKESLGDAEMYRDITRRKQQILRFKMTGARPELHFSKRKIKLSRMGLVNKTWTFLQFQVSGRYQKEGQHHLCSFFSGERVSEEKSLFYWDWKGRFSSWVWKFKAAFGYILFPFEKHCLLCNFSF